MTRFNAPIYAALVLGLCWPQAAFAEQGALVIDVSGPVTPSIEAFEEAQIGAEFQIGEGAEIVLAHDSDCAEVTISGGSVGIGPSGLLLTSADVTDKVDLDCPRQVPLLDPDSTSATVNLRRLIPLVRIPLAPEIVVTGAKASGLERLELLRKGTMIATLPIEQRRVRWPEQGLVLSDRKKYILRVVGPAGTYVSEVVADRSQGARVVLRP